MSWHQVDHRAECVLVPIYGQLVPFHILTVRNASNNQVPHCLPSAACTSTPLFSSCCCHWRHALSHMPANLSASFLAFAGWRACLYPAQL